MNKVVQELDPFTYITYDDTDNEEEVIQPNHNQKQYIPFYKARHISSSDEPLGPSSDGSRERKWWVLMSHFCRSLSDAQSFYGAHIASTRE
jgi:hypothetical protein